MAATDLTASPRSTLRRKAERGSHDRGLVEAILDEGLLCHVGFVDGGAPVVLPTAYARVGDELYLHGAVGNQMLRALASGVPACVTVTLLDGIVLARSAKHHSMNYRSVVLFGTARKVTDAEEKRRALLHIVDHMAPGRSGDARPPNDAELTATLVLAFPVDEGSAKVRTGGPVDDEEDLALAVWAGELPLTLGAGTPVADHGVAGPAPAYLAGYERGRAGAGRR
jgi:nitroimidazol reductase NimA-like FMN-containing flavoprotein (pyridoxamine 5'-phosphate oxidase superfamily)